MIVSRIAILTNFTLDNQSQSLTSHHRRPLARELQASRPNPAAPRAAA